MGFETATTKQKKSETVLTSSLVLIGVTFLTKLAAFFKEILIAAKFGVSETTDAFFIAFTIPNVLLFLLGIDLIKGTSASIFSSYLARGRREEFSQVFSSIFNLTFIFASGVILLGIWQMPAIISLIAPTFSGTQLATTIALARILLTILLLMGLTNYLSASLNALNRFFVPALAVLIANLTIVLFLLFLSRRIGIYSVAWGYCGGFGFSLLFLLAYISTNGVKYKTQLISNLPEVTSFIKKSSPLLILTTFSQINILVERSIASRLAVGGISALSFAHKINQMAIEICIIPILTVLLPTLSREYSINQTHEFRERIEKSTEIICLILVPLTVVFVMFSQELVHIVFERGVFSNRDTLKTSSALLFYALGLLPHGLYLFFITNYLALQKTLTLGKIGAIASCINIALNLILVQFFEYRGIALAWSISSTFYLFLLLFVFKKKLMGSSYQVGIKPYVKILTSGVIMGLSLYFLKNSVTLICYGLLGLLFLAASGVLIYFIFLIIFQDSHATRVVNYVRARTKAFKN